MCAMFAEFEECLRPTCANCYAMPGPTGLCRHCASEVLVTATDLVSSSTGSQGGSVGLGTQVPEAMISSATSEDAFSPPLRHMPAPASVEPDLWELLPDAAVHVQSPERPPLGEAALEWTSSSGGAVSSTVRVAEEEAARRRQDEPVSNWEQVTSMEPLADSWQDSPSPPRHAVSETLADSWEETPNMHAPGPELWSVVPAEVLASAAQRRSDFDAQGGEGAGVQHVIAGGIIVEESREEEATQLAMSLTHFQAEASAQNSSAEAASRIRPPTSDIEDALDPAVSSATSSESPALGQSLCIVCVKAAAVATFVHGLTGHTACCLACAQEVERRGRSCPVCRQVFTSVIRNFVTT